MATPTPKPYVFQGLAPFIEAAAEVRKVDSHLIGQIKNSWHARQVQNTLGQIAQIAANPHAPANATDEVFSYVSNIVVSAVAGVEGCVAALVEVAKAHGLDLTHFDFLSAAESAKDELAKLKTDFDAFKAEAAKALDAANAEVAKLKAAAAQTDAEHKQAHDDAKAIVPKPPAPAK